MKIVVLDGYTVNPGDLSWEVIEKIGETTIFDRTSSDKIMERSLDAEVLVVNKVQISAEHLQQLPILKCICLLATGYDNVDIVAAKQKGVQVFNAVGYGTESVAQHTLAMMLAYTNKVESHHRSVQAGHWSNQEDFSYSLNTVSELNGKNLGIVGYGKIGRRVGELARAFGMQVCTSSRQKKSRDVHSVALPDLFGTCHFISLHTPLNANTKHMINKDSLAGMRKDAVIINTGRGGLINEDDLIEALLEKRISGAVLDVLAVEPPIANNRLLHLKNVMVTPHMAWRSKEARNNLIKMVAKNINNFAIGRYEESLV